eukprot:gnl/MRDRNA2_/MRDRNA2_146324_c0_seq1.p1 gnl/MRDRNA2_/MRDRNA2_146324_c0~~gnl/MRDRNA2_/MRDRNA2_146324_c0_seq1.p1  ORF type:complete len:468 (-),score=69.43 gnl/MRDRNA2_/MRDRNA2_146324_c0_seq1:302-1705(-)
MRDIFQGQKVISSLHDFLYHVKSHLQGGSNEYPIDAPMDAGCYWEKIFAEYGSDPAGECHCDHDLHWEQYGSSQEEEQWHSILEEEEEWPPQTSDGCSESPSAASEVRRSLGKLFSWRVEDRANNATLRSDDATAMAQDDSMKMEAQAMPSDASCNESCCHPCDLSEKEKESLTFLREKLQLGHPRFTNAFLFRFLHARKFDLEKTADMLQAHLDFRKTWCLDEPTHGCLYGPGPPELAYPKLPHIKKYWPHGYHGVDRQGRVIYIERLGDADVDKVMQEVDFDYLTAYFIHLSERVIVYRHPAATLASKRLIDKTLVIVDLKGVSYRKITDSRVVKILKSITVINQGNYPEVLGGMIIVNAPYIFSWLWSVIHPWLDPVTAAKFEIFGCDQSAIQKRLTELVAPEELPEFLGGTCTCADAPDGCMGSNKGPWLDPRISETLETMPYWEINNCFFHTRNAGAKCSCN